MFEGSIMSERSKRRAQKKQRVCAMCQYHRRIHTKYPTMICDVCSNPANREPKMDWVTGLPVVYISMCIDLNNDGTCEYYEEKP